MTGRPSWPWRRSLRARLIASFLLLSTVTLLVVGAIVYLRATDDLTNGVYDRLDAVASVKADALDRWIDEQTRNVVYVGAIPGFGDDARIFLDPAATSTDRDGAGARLRSDLETVVGKTADAEEIFILDLDGNIRLSTLAGDEGKAQATESFFTDGSSHTTVQNVYTSDLTGRPTITVATPLFDQDGGGQRVAVLAANLSLQRLDRIVQERTGLGETGRTYLVGPDSRLIQGTVAGAVGAGAVDSTGIEAVLAQRSGQGLYDDDRGTPVVGVYQWLGDRGAGLLAEISQDEAFGSARQLAVTIAVVGLISTCLLIAGIWVIARRVTQPILSLARTAQQVTLGDLDAVSGIESEDEVGTLAVAFDGMTAQLRENVATLEHRVAERTAELNRQRSYYAALVEVSPVAVVTMDQDERVTAWNPTATRLFGFEPDEAIGRSIDELILRSDELRAEGHDLAREAATSGRVSRIGRRMRKDGSVLDVEVLMVPLEVDGERLGYYAIYHDITELQAARREADAANQAKSSFLAAMSHEIRTPMNAVIGMSGLLVDSPLDERQRDYAETIQTSGEALLTIINDILDFSKIEAGRIELEAIPFNLADTIKGAFDVMRPLAEKKGLRLVSVVDPALPPTVVGDGGRLRQIVLNLLSNAVKFTDQGEVALSVGGRRIDVAGDDAAAPGRWEIHLDVHDSGIGMTPEGLGRLFQSFSQADASITRRYGGTGLGLAISRRLAELMDGTLTAESAGVPGEGSTFHLVIQVVAAAASSSVAASSDTAPRAAIDPAMAARHPLRILLAEDNPVNQKLAHRLLERMGYTAEVAANGREAIEALDGAPFDVVLMDVQMPELDGMEATREIRTRWPDRAIHIIAMTADAMDGDREACLAAGMDDYVSKPIRPDALAAALVAAPGAEADEAPPGEPAPTADAAPA